MSRLIDADKLHCDVLKINDEGDEIVFVYQSDIDAAPTVDAVPVVRCRDCKWWDKKPDSLYGYCHAYKYWHLSERLKIGIYRVYKGDWFCADGERREDDAKEST